MENNSHSDPSLFLPKGSKVPAASSVASVSHVKGITMKLKKPDLVLGGDGEVGSWKKTRRSTQLLSLCSDKASSPFFRKKIRINRIHLMAVVNRSNRSLPPPAFRKDLIKRNVVLRVRPNHLSRPELPSSNTDGEAQSAGEASAPLSRKKKISQWAQLNEGINIASIPSFLIKDRNYFLPLRNEDILAEDIGTPKQKKNEYIQPDRPSSQGAGDVSINHALVVDNCLDANLTMDKSIPPASLGSSRSEESTWMQENKVNIPIPVTEEKVPADHKQKQGSEEEEIKELLEKVGSLKAKLKTTNVDFWCTCEERQQAEIYQRLSRYYSKALELSGEEPDYAELNEESEVPLRVYEFFFLDRVVDYNREWYFHPESCKLAGLDDYQRLVLRDDCTYGDMEDYRRTYHTYQGDLEYVQFREKMSEKIEWIADEAVLFGDQRLKNELVAYIQSLEIALQFPNISRRSVVYALREHLDSFEFEFKYRKDVDDVYLEIWKSVAKDKVDFDVALSQLYEKNIFPYRRDEIKVALDSYPGFCLIKYNYDTFVDGIDEKLSEDEARPLVIEAVEKMFKRQKNYLDYARKKLEIAERIGLPKMSSRDVIAKGWENHGEDKAAIAS